MKILQYQGPPPYGNMGASILYADPKNDEKLFGRFLIKILRFRRFYPLLATFDLTVESAAVDLPGVKGQNTILIDFGTFFRIFRLFDQLRP